MARTQPSWPPRGRSTPRPQELAVVLEAAEEEPIFERIDDLFDRKKLEAAVQRKVRSLRGRIAVVWKELPADARGIILQIAREESASWRQVGAEWLVQRLLFLEMGKRFDLRRLERFSRSCPDCFLVLTQRSSLITGDTITARASGPSSMSAYRPELRAGTRRSPSPVASRRSAAATAPSCLGCGPRRFSSSCRFRRPAP